MYVAPHADLKCSAQSGSIFVAGQIVLFITALPFAFKDKGTVLGGFVTAMILIGLGQGGTTAVVFPFLGDRMIRLE